MKLCTRCVAAARTASTRPRSSACVPSTSRCAHLAALADEVEQRLEAHLRGLLLLLEDDLRERDAT